MIGSATEGPSRQAYNERGKGEKTTKLLNEQNSLKDFLSSDCMISLYVRTGPLILSLTVLPHRRRTGDGLGNKPNYSIDIN
jgi:hypothetical protein